MFFEITDLISDNKPIHQSHWNFAILYFQFLILVPYHSVEALEIYFFTFLFGVLLLWH